MGLYYLGIYLCVQHSSPLGSALSYIQCLYSCDAISARFDSDENRHLGTEGV